MTGIIRYGLSLLCLLQAASVLAAFSVFSAATTAATISTATVIDDLGHCVSLGQPARRIIALSPHATELLFAAGAGEHVIAVVDYSDYPAEAKTLPRIGSGSALDIERIVALKPDLVVSWASGNGPSLYPRLRALGIRVFASEPRSLEDIASNLERLGQLAGTAAAAQDAANAFRRDTHSLSHKYRHQPPVRVFYQIWDQPLMTINGEHLISQLIGLCGGVNVFAPLPGLTPHIDIEAVLAAQPDAIIASGSLVQSNAWKAAWRQWPQLPAVQHQALFGIDPDIIQRQGPRIAQGMAQLCKMIDQARQAAPNSPAQP